jgi:hypothetical protein
MLPPQHSNYGVAGEAGLAYGLGLRAARVPRDMCRGIPGHSSLRPQSMWSHPWMLSRATRTPSHAWMRVTRSMCGGCRCIPGTMTCRRFKDRMISKISEIYREHPWTTRQLFNSITLGHNNDPTLQIISWEGFCQA